MIPCTRSVCLRVLAVLFLLAGPRYTDQIVMEGRRRVDQKSRAYASAQTLTGTSSHVCGA